MSPNAPSSSQRACRQCQRRSWLLGALGATLDYRARDRGRLIEVLALEDQDLIAALAGRRRAELRAAYEAFRRDQLGRAGEIEALCHHHRDYPHMLNSAAAPRMLNVAGGVDRLNELTSVPVVAILGSRKASDYGMETARSLAHGLAASGVTVACSLADGIAHAAQMGTLEVNGGALAVMGGGLIASRPARRRSLFAGVSRVGCVVSELPCDCVGRRWGQLAGERIVVELAQLAVVVEAAECAEDLAAARIAQELGRTVAAIPGRVTSPLSRGPHALVVEGARLIRGAADALELLYPPGSPSLPRSRRASVDAALDPKLKAILQQIGAGRDTAEKLTSGGARASDVLLALSELELLGLLRRGDGGRYLPCQTLAAEC